MLQDYSPTSSYHYEVAGDTLFCKQKDGSEFHPHLTMRSRIFSLKTAKMTVAGQKDGSDF